MPDLIPTVRAPDFLAGRQGRIFDPWLDPDRMIGANQKMQNIYSLIETLADVEQLDALEGDTVDRRARSELVGLRERPDPGW